MRTNGLWLLSVVSNVVFSTVCFGQTVDPPVAQVDIVPPIAQVSINPPIAQVDIVPLKKDSGVIVGTVVYPQYVYPQYPSYNLTVPGVTVQSRPFHSPGVITDTTPGIHAPFAERRNTSFPVTGAGNIRTLAPVVGQHGVTNCTSVG